MKLMTSLWGDGWFYISALGFLGSSALFLYLLGQYRSAVEGSDESEEAPALAPQPLAADYVPPPMVTAVVVPDAQKEEATLVLPPGETSPQPVAADAEPRRGETGAGGGLSPAAVYLQNIKSQMDKFDKEIAALKAAASQQVAQEELVLKRLAELAEAVKAGKAPPSLEEPAVLRPPERATAAAPAAVLPASAAPPSPAAEPKSAAPEPVIEALPQTPEQPAAPSQPRKRPVWPV